MVGLDRRRREIHVAAYHDAQGELVTPGRAFAYDTLILAVGSQSNDFGVPGVATHALRLESLSDAKDFNRKLTNACFRAQAQVDPFAPWQLQVVIVGAGATGVELAAEVRHSALEILDVDSPARFQFRIHLVEASARILPALPPRLAEAATRELQEKGVQVLTSAGVARVDQRAVYLSDGRVLPSELTLWAAGIRAPAFLSELGLETNRLNQVVTTPTLRSTRDDNIFVLGDCAACPSSTDAKKTLPPRAQVASQQANFLIRHFSKIVRGERLPEFRYRDFGSLVSLGTLSAVGNLMGALAGRNLSVAGSLARLIYVSMYKRHEMAIHGLPATVLETLSRSISANKGARVKLH
jgi:NADH dehydrogenase